MLYFLSFLFISIVVVILGLRYTEHMQNESIKENIKDESEKNVWIRNPKITFIMDNLSFVRHYNESVYRELMHVVKKILKMYYKFIGGSKRVKIDDFSYEKVRLLNVYEEISMNIPNKYHARTKKNLIKLNKELNKKMKLMKLHSSSKSPIKISLMNTNLSF